MADAPEDVIVGFDGSPQAEDALGLGRRLAEAIGARLVVANVFFVPRSLDPARLSAHEEDERMRAQGMLTIAAAQVDYPDVEYVAVGSASAARGLHDLADERDAVALVVGSTDRGDVGTVAPGSVARRLLERRAVRSGDRAAWKAPNGWRPSASPMTAPTRAATRYTARFAGTARGRARGRARRGALDVDAERAPRRRRGRQQRAGGTARRPRAPVRGGADLDPRVPARVGPRSGRRPGRAARGELAGPGPARVRVAQPRPPAPGAARQRFGAARGPRPLLRARGPARRPARGREPDPLRNVVRALPGARMLATYRPAWLRRDLVAGLVLTTLLVPQGMAYAELAGLPAITGLYTTILCLLGYAVFGPSRILVLGPDSSLGPMIAATILPIVGADGDPERGDRARVDAGADGRRDHDRGRGRASSGSSPTCSPSRRRSAT